jgi:hypothetical protein
MLRTGLRRSKENIGQINTKQENKESKQIKPLPVNVQTINRQNELNQGYAGLGKGIKKKIVDVNLHNCISPNAMILLTIFYTNFVIRKIVLTFSLSRQ